jgi:hypothetical protein
LGSGRPQHWSLGAAVRIINLTGRKLARWADFARAAGGRRWRPTWRASDVTFAWLKIPGDGVLTFRALHLMDFHSTKSEFRVRPFFSYLHRRPTNRAFTSGRTGPSRRTRGLKFLHLPFKLRHALRKADDSLPDRNLFKDFDNVRN